MRLYRNMKIKVCSLEGETDFFDIVAGVLQGDTLAPYLFIFCQVSGLRTLIDLIKENGFTLEKARRRWYLANTTTQAETLLHSPEQGAGGIDLHMNTNKMEYMFFNQEEAISTLNSGLMKLVDKFMYLNSSSSSSISSVESDVSMHWAKAQAIIDRLLII